MLTYNPADVDQPVNFSFRDSIKGRSNDYLILFLLYDFTHAYF